MRNFQDIPHIAKNYSNIIYQGNQFGKFQHRDKCKPRFWTYAQKLSLEIKLNSNYVSRRKLVLTDCILPLFHLIIHINTYQGRLVFAQILIACQTTCCLFLLLLLLIAVVLWTLQARVLQFKLKVTMRKLDLHKELSLQTVSDLYFIFISLKTKNIKVVLLGPSNGDKLKEISTERNMFKYVWRPCKMVIMFKTY